MSLITEPSICIPRTLNNINWRQVKETFEQLFGPGTVERVDIVTNRTDASPFCRIFVHMRYWPVEKAEIADIRQRLVDGETVKVVYDNPWFWKCSASRTPKPDRTRPRAAPFVELTPRVNTNDDEVKTEEVKTETKTEEVKTETETEEVKTEEVKTETETEEVKTETEEVKTDEVKTEEVKTEEVKTEEVKTE
jgi:hypothetical protein